MSETKKIYNKRYYDKKKDELAEKQKVKCTCILCGRVVTKGRMLRHTRSNLCLKNRPEETVQI